MPWPFGALFAVIVFAGAGGLVRAQAEDTGAAIAAEGTPDGVPPCATCHGAQGQGNVEGGFPRLAGLSASYIQAQLAAFASGQRNNAVMASVAKMLTTNQAQAVAAYFANLPEPALPQVAPTANETGAMLALDGRWSNRIPACIACHGPDGTGVGTAFPPLIGQPASYLKSQLEAWQQDKRPPGPLGLMAAIAKRLTAADVTNVTQWFATLTRATAK